METDMRSQTLVQMGNVLQGFAENRPGLLGYLFEDSQESAVDASETIKNIQNELKMRQMDMNYTK